MADSVLRPCEMQTPDATYLMYSNAEDVTCLDVFILFTCCNTDLGKRKKFLRETEGGSSLEINCELKPVKCGTTFFFTQFWKGRPFHSHNKVQLEKNATGLTLNISGSIRDRLDLQSSANRSGIRL